MSILPLLLSLLAVNTVSCSEAPSTAQLLEMVQKLTGRLEKLEEKGNLTDEVGKLGEVMTGAMEKLGDKTEKLGEAMTGTVKSLGESMTKVVLYSNPPSSCLDVVALDGNVHTLKVRNRRVKVFCDQDTEGGGWTVIQRRRDGSVDFYRNWEEYRKGFGDVNGEFWLGLENIHLLTTARNQTLRVDLEDFANNTAYAKYRFLAIDGPDSFYRLHVGGYSGTAGDSLAYHNGQPFTTLDSDHDPDPTTECAVYNHGAWWYNRCHYSNLNGPYLTFAQKTYKSISWKHWKNSFIALKHVEMKIRPAL